MSPAALGEGLGHRPEGTTRSMTRLSSIATFYVRRPCCMFWTFLACNLLLSVVGSAILVSRAQANGQASIFSEQGSYDWSVAGKTSVLNSDKVRLAYEQANDDNDDYPSRRRLAGLSEQQQEDVLEEQDATGRSLSESGSGDTVDDEDAPERSRTANGRYSTMFVYMAKDGVDNILTPPILKQMCEVENVILGAEDFGKVCYNASTTVSERTTDPSGRQCTLPSNSIVSLFYMLWDTTVHNVADVHAAMAQVSSTLTLIDTTVEGTANLQVWWNTAANAAAVANIKASVEAVSAAATPLNPGGSFSSQYGGLITGIDAFAAQLGGAGGFALLGSKTVSTITLPGPPSTTSPSLYSLLTSLNAFLGGTGNLKPAFLDQMTAFGGLPFRGLPTKAPVKGVDTFTKADSHTRDCRLLDADYVTSRRTQLFDLAHGSAAMRNAIGFFLGADSMTSNKTTISRGIVDLGKPRKAPYEKDKELGDKWLLAILEPSLWKHFGMKTAFLKSAYRDPATTDDLTVRYNNGLLFSKEFGTIVNNDFLMVGAALIFVWVYICLHTGSFPLGCLAILQIVLSLPMALFFYAPFVPYFSNLHLLALFLCLGVGADDVFVFMDAWRQSASQPSLRTLAARMVYTYERTFYTVLNTSFTTAIAFFASATASIMPIASFGVFAALAILLNWVLTVTWWPCAVLMWELYFCRARGIGCCFSCQICDFPASPCFIKDQTTDPYYDPNARRASVTGTTQPEKAAEKLATAQTAAETTKAGHEMPVLTSLTLSERFFYSVYAPVINWSVGPQLPLGLKIKPVSIALVVGLGSMGAYLTSEALTLTTPDEEPVWFPANHMATGMGDLLRTSFLAGDDANYISGAFYFGIAGVDAPFFSKWEPGKNRGSVRFEPSFDLSNGAAQDAFIKFCDDLEKEDCIMPGANDPLPMCSRAPFKLTSTGTTKCFLREWKAERGSLPTGDVFDNELHAWLESSGGRGYASDVGFINGTIHFARVQFRWSALDGLPVAQLRLLHDRTLLLVTSKFTPTATLAAPFVYNRGFSWMETSEELVQVVLQGFQIIFPCAWFILWASTGSFITACLATLSVGLITGSLLGGVKIAYGFALGISEAIAGNIVIGLSVDYTLHLSHSYVFGDGKTREDKLRHAVTMMGVTVVAGAITTFTSALFMAPCQLTFFGNMVVLIGGTIMFSVIYALGFFMPLMALIGPTGPPRSALGHVMALMNGNKGSQDGGGTRAAGGEVTPETPQMKDTF